MRFLGFWALLIFATTSYAGVVEFHDNQLFIDGQSQPQLYGAELQYFRLRGGYGPNVPRAKVIELWNRALDKMVEAKMNTISFYIPWDFHEYADGKYDFTGTVDEDGDGNPDYPSRDIFAFFKLIEAHGINKIMARPGPYINAEWGFLGFGAVPKWFHEKFPDSHMRNSMGLKTKLYDYHNPDLLNYSQRWIEVLHKTVLKNYIGPGKPISFMQLDNETNFMWQSIFNHDYGPRAINRYRAFLQTRYKDISEFNTVTKKRFGSWENVTAPTVAGSNKAEDQEWYRFQDESMHSYLQKVRQFWVRLGVDEPTVLFTLAESYNAMKDGILPNYHYRNNPSKTGMMTVNLYPKTYDLPHRPLMNLPFKSDHDVKAADTASDAYLGQKVEWVFGPEIQGGWWKGIDVTEESRRQTYLTTIGHGLKALMIYYFHEGDNWQVEWAYQQIRPMYDSLKKNTFAVDAAFWNNLQKKVDQEFMVGFDVKSIMETDLDQAKVLFFDAPLDHNARSRDHFQSVLDVGTKLVEPYGDFLGAAVAIQDDVCLLRDDLQHIPTNSPKLDSLVMNGDWMGGLLGYLLQSGINPRIHHWGLNPSEELSSCRIILRQDNNLASAGLNNKLKAMLENGATIINFMDSQLPKALGLGTISREASGRAEWVSFLYDNTHSLFSATPYFYYDLGTSRNCKHNMYHNQESVGYSCQVGKGTFVQVGAQFYGILNSDNYVSQKDIPQKRAFIEFFLRATNTLPQIQVREGGDRLAIFGRTDGVKKWITVKSGQSASVRFHVLVRNLSAQTKYKITDLYRNKTEVLDGTALMSNGFNAELAPHGSSVFVVEASR